MSSSSPHIRAVLSMLQLQFIWIRYHCKKTSPVPYRPLTGKSKAKHTFCGKKGQRASILVSIMYIMYIWAPNRLYLGDDCYCYVTAVLTITILICRFEAMYWPDDGCERKKQMLLSQIIGKTDHRLIEINLAQKKTKEKISFHSSFGFISQFSQFQAISPILIGHKSRN